MYNYHTHSEAHGLLSSARFDTRSFFIVFLKKKICFKIFMWSNCYFFNNFFVRTFQKVIGFGHCRTKYWLYCFPVRAPPLVKKYEFSPGYGFDRTVNLFWYR